MDLWPTRQAVYSSISALSCHIIHQNVGNDVLYHCVNRDVDTMTASYQTTVYSAEILARRHMPWFEGGGVCCVLPYSYLRHTQKLIAGASSTRLNFLVQRTLASVSLITGFV